MPTQAAIIGSGTSGTDLMVTILRLTDELEVATMVGIDPESDGLARAARMGVPTTHLGVDGLVDMDGFEEIDIVFDATSAKAHLANAERLAALGRRLVDLTPAAIGPPVVPAVNLQDVVASGPTNVNMVTCGGQATIPIVHAVARVTQVAYAEIVASISSRSAGPGTRANIDEFTATTSAAIESVGGAGRGKAIIILNPAKPPMVMRDTVYCLIGDADHGAIRDSVAEMVDAVSEYVPGYRLKQQVQFTPVASFASPHVLLPDSDFEPRTRVTVFLEVEGAAHYLPAYAGNLDIMTSAALRVGIVLARASAPVTMGGTS